MVTKKAPAKKVAKKVPAKKAPAKKAAAKKVAATPPVAETAAMAAAAPAGIGIGIGSIVMFTDNGQTVGPGRLCALFGIGNACVMFGDGIGCQRVTADLLSLAPPGSTAPPCDGCDDC